MFRGSFKLRAVEEKEGLYGFACLEAQIDIESLKRIYVEFAVPDEGPKITSEPFFYGKTTDLEDIIRRPSHNWAAQLTRMERAHKKDIDDLGLSAKQKNMLDYSFSLLPGVLKGAKFTTHPLPIDYNSRKRALSYLLTHFPESFVDKVNLAGRYLSAQRDIC